MDMKKIRLDVLLVERGLADSRNLAQRLVMAGQVRVNGERVLRSSANVSPDVQLAVDQGPPYVSRGGEKLAAALTKFGVDVHGQICADVGASTGGFTDCLLQHGASRVYAIDVGHGILDWKLRQDPRVVVMEGTNARLLVRLPEPVQVITIDVSFISLKVILPVVWDWLLSQENHPIGSVIALVKPQFEAGRKEVSRGKGVIRDPAVHRQVLTDVLSYAYEIGFSVHGLIRSPLIGPKGNVEFLAWLECNGGQAATIEDLISNVLIYEGSPPRGVSFGS
ncbi:MAG TPA: TlyA family RNA methyltransferase [Anaerolineales bacterium]|nr:TlyA family RNA methyltransferase [Anaerolineales bacterium]